MNLIPLEYRLKLKYQKDKKRNIVISLFILAIMLGFTLYNYKSILTYQEEMIVLNNRLDSLKPVMAEKRLLDEQRAKLKDKQELINRLSQDISYHQLLIDLNRLIPEDVVLNNFIINQNQHLQINAESINNGKVIKTVNQMEEYPYFAEISLKYSEVRENKVAFGIEGRLDL
ncbi:Fimbrial assembly protein (PilN) [Orenia metallireducens]|uniref:Fimbrial assembly protein (PilN) n=1 Tax=Orenia metallireducens TaxID=1413210 RepID=A0A285I7Z1_9FIRM|nr:PilN domain-containing protein [Orenia metallireducens]SNY43176.1 Fimbrial assembly protein (PilN) [Orenia metallireducens]